MPIKLKEVDAILVIVCHQLKSTLPFGGVDFCFAFVFFVPKI